MIQSDFSYMISPGFFDTYVKDEVNSTAGHMKNAFYHLDGVGQLPHLDSLLSLPNLQGIQWVPGEGRARDERLERGLRLKYRKRGKNCRFIIISKNIWTKF